VGERQKDRSDGQRKTERNERDTDLASERDTEQETDKPKERDSKIEAGENRRERE